MEFWACIRMVKVRRQYSVGNPTKMRVEKGRLSRVASRGHVTSPVPGDKTGAAHTNVVTIGYSVFFSGLRHGKYSCGIGRYVIPDLSQSDQLKRELGKEEKQSVKGTGHTILHTF